MPPQRHPHHPLPISGSGLDLERIQLTADSPLDELQRLQHDLQPLLGQQLAHIESFADDADAATFCDRLLYAAALLATVNEMLADLEPNIAAAANNNSRLLGDPIESAAVGILRLAHGERHLARVLQLYDLAGRDAGQRAALLERLIAACASQSRAFKAAPSPNIAAEAGQLLDRIARLRSRSAIECVAQRVARLADDDCAAPRLRVEHMLHIWLRQRDDDDDASALHRAAAAMLYDRFVVAVATVPVVFVRLVRQLAGRVLDSRPGVALFVRCLRLRAFYAAFVGRLADVLRAVRIVRAEDDDDGGGLEFGWTAATRRPLDGGDDDDDDDDGGELEAAMRRLSVEDLRRICCCAAGAESPVRRKFAAFLRGVAMAPVVRLAITETAMYD